MSHSPMMFTLAQAQQWIPGARLVGDGATAIARVHTDTRTLADGDLFVALKGERFDANEFLADAKARGAVAAIAHGGLEAAGLAGLEVPDSLAALGALGAGWRAQFDLPLIAVTGSNGKTTVTQMIAAVLVAFRGDRALATAGNFNNEIGVPLTLLRLRAKHQHAVVELGMNHPGEIARLAAIARPTVALVNNAQREHLEFMATVEAVALENGAVFSFVPEDGTAVFPHGDEFAPLWNDMAHDGATRRCMTFGEHEDADISLVGAEWQQGAWQVRIRTPLGDFDAQLHIAGRHNVVNALAATACALATGIPPETIARGLSAFEPVKGRSRRARCCCPAAIRSRWWTTATTPIPIPCARPSTCSRPCPVRASWCSATWARSATARPSSMPRSATGRASAASRPCMRSAPKPRTASRPSTAATTAAISRTSRRSAPRCWRGCPRWGACSSRARAS